MELKTSGDILTNVEIATKDVTQSTKSNDIESAAGISTAVAQTLNSLPTSTRSANVERIVNITTTLVQSLINEDVRISSPTQDKIRVGSKKFQHFCILSLSI